MKTRVLLAVAAIIVTTSGAGPRSSLRAQTRDGAVRPIGTGVIGGLVVSDEQTPRPLRRASVVLAMTGVPGTIEVTTDDAGRFAFANLAAGRYSLTATKPSFVKTFYGSKAIGRGPSAPLVLANGERMMDLTVTLVRGAVIGGVVIDQNGMPVSSAGVSVEQMQTVNGERKLVAVSGFQQFSTTDDRGQYRIFGLPPGEYAIRAGNSSGMPGDIRESSESEIAAALRDLQGAPASSAAGVTRPAPPPSAVGLTGAYYPGVENPASAEFIKVGPGDERTGIDIRKTLTRIVRVRVDGTAVGPSGQPLSNIMVGIANATAGTMWASPGIVRPGLDGRFTLDSMPPGRWILFGRGTEGSGQVASMTLWTETEFEVGDRDISDLVMSLVPGVTVSGQLVFSGATPAPDPAALRVAILGMPKIPSAFVNSPSMTPTADGKFTFAGVAPGRYRLTVTGAARWSLRSAIVAGRDVLDSAMDVVSGRDTSDVVVTLTDRPTEVSGMLLDQQNRPTPEYAVVMFSADRSHWLSSPRRMTGLVKIGADGKFVITGLPPGEYYLSAVTDLDPTQLTDPSALEQLAAVGVKITLGEGEHKIQNLKIG